MAKDPGLKIEFSESFLKWLFTGPMKWVLKWLFTLAIPSVTLIAALGVGGFRPHMEQEAAPFIQTEDESTQSIEQSAD